MKFEPGQQLSSYELLEKIGEGGMGAVFRAFDQKLERQVAIKVLLPELMADEAKRRRFLREAHTSASVSHPYIASVYEVGEDAGTAFLVMEYVEGDTLRARLRKKPIPIPEALRLATEIVEGLAHAHGAQIIHRDLKPENIIVRPDGHPKILDFGVAKLMQPGEGIITQDGSSHGSLTAEGRIVGTVAYMSPEQARGKEVDARSDIFSFGIVLYEMLTGRAPFAGSEAIDTLSSILKEEPVPAAEINPDLSPPLQQILVRCLEKDPANRYERAEDLMADLKVATLALQEQALRTKSAEYAASVTGDHAAAGRKVMPALAWTAIAAVLVVGATLGYLRLGAREQTDDAGIPSSAPSTAGDQRKMIVVLPFENLGNPEDEYFAAGVTDEITSRLAAVSGIGVISRASAIQYAGTEKSIRQIGAELGVGYVLDGTIRWARNDDGASRVRITPKLIRVADDTHLWAGAYDEVIDDIFKVQSEIAVKVIDRLGVALQATEWEVMDARPTENPEAYQAYLGGRNYSRRPEYTEENFKRQVKMYEKAVELDPDFAVAYASLSTAHSALYHFGHDRTHERQEMARRAVDRALELAPDSPEAHVALGWYYYWGHKDYEKALEAFGVARRSMPNDAELIGAEAFVHRRQGNWKEAAEELETAAELNPRDGRLIMELGDTYVSLRDYPKAERWLDKAIDVVPDQSLTYGYKAHMYWLWEGRTDKARAALEAMPVTDDPASLWYRFWTEIYEDRYQEAVDRLDASPVDVIREQFFFAPKELLSAQALALKGEPAASREAFDAARKILEAELETRPDDHRIRSALGIALAGLGLREEAIREGLMATEIYPLSRDANAGFPWVENLALIYTMAGELDAALERIDQLLSVPSKMSLPLLRLDPRWSPLIADPRFRQLEDRHGGNSPGR